MRSYQILLIGSTLLGSWLGMQAVHEAGHVLGAQLTGGRVAQVVLHPLTISRTDLADNPSPLVVVWAGPVFGAVAPLAWWGVWSRVRLPGAFTWRFFAGFCLLANGLYVGVGSFDAVGDCGEMLRHGSPTWTLWAFGASTAPVGLWLWHGLGPSFGLGAAKGQVDGRVALGWFVGVMILIVWMGTHG